MKGAPVGEAIAQLEYWRHAMSAKEQSHPNSARESKRAQFSKSARQKSRTKLVLVLVALAGFAIYLVMSSSPYPVLASSFTVRKLPADLRARGGWLAT